MATISVPFTGGTGNGTQTTHSIKFPAGVTEATIHLWGTGGAGGGAISTTAGSGGGGAGGQYARSVIEVDDETTYTLRVGNRRTGGTGDGGAGVDSDWETNVIVAKGGAGGLSAVNGGTGASGSAVGGVGDVVYAGGNGSDGDGATASGAGGGGAGTTGAGGNASGTTAGTGTSEGGGNGGAGRTTAGFGGTGLNYGGGGGGGLNTATTNRNGGISGRGGAIIEFEYNTVEISSWAELAAIQDGGVLFMYMDYILTESIDKDSTGYSTYASATANTNTGWIPIGTVASLFQGTFNGQFNTIGDLVINRGGSDYQGLFVGGPSAEIRNLKVIDADITGRGFSSILCAAVNAIAMIEKCGVTGKITGTRDTAVITNSSPNGMNQCWADIEVICNSNNSGYYSGVLCGQIRNTVTDCYAKGSVTTTGENNRRGGIAGQRVGSTIRRCFSTAEVLPTGGTQGGAMVGFSAISNIQTNNYYDEETSGWTTSQIGTAKTTAEMKDKDTYVDWDFDDVWDIRSDRNDGYPYLRWEYPDDEPVLTGAAFLLLMV